MGGLNGRLHRGNLSHRGLIILLLVLKFLNTDHLSREEVLCSDEVLLDLGLGGNRSCQIGLGLVQRCLEGSRIDLEERLTLLHHASLCVVALDDVACDIRFHQRGDGSLEVPDPLLVVGHVFLKHHTERHRNRRTRSCWSGLLLAGRER